MDKSIIRIYIYGLLKRETCGGNYIHISKILPIIKWAIRVPKKYQRELLSEMIRCDLLKRKDRDNYELNTCKFKSPVDSLGEPLW